MRYSRDICPQKNGTTIFLRCNRMYQASRREHHSKIKHELTNYT